MYLEQPLRARIAGSATRASSSRNLILRRRRCSKADEGAEGEDEDLGAHDDLVDELRGVVVFFASAVGMWTGWRMPFSGEIGEPFIPERRRSDEEYAAETCRRPKTNHGASMACGGDYTMGGKAR